MLALDMGCGKSRVAVDLVRDWQAQTVLILCPKSVLGVWRREFEKFAPGQFDVRVLDKGTTIKKLQTAKERLEIGRVTHRPQVIVMNYETARQSEMGNWLLSKTWDVVLLDESHRVKDPQGQTGKLMGKLGHCARRRLALTGTPMPHSPLDIFSQYRFVDPTIFGNSFHRFRNQYARTNPMFPSRVDEWLNQDHLQEQIGRAAFRVKAGDVLALPPKNHHERRIQLSPKTARVHREMNEELIADLETGVVTAANALVRLLRLQQIANGFTRADEEEEITRLSSEKFDFLEDLLLDIPDKEPVVVFCLFRPDLDEVKRLAERTGRTHGELSGRQHDLDDHGCMPEGVTLFGVQLQSGGVGVDLTRARYAVYISVGFNMGNYDQSLARLHRPGQTRPVHYFHLLADQTVDDAVYGALRNRRDLVDGVLEYMRKTHSATPAASEIDSVFA